MNRLMLLAALALAGCDNGPSAVRPQPPAGRYTVAPVPGDAVMLDTATGRSWVLARDDKGVMSWVELVRSDSPAPTTPTPVE